MMSCCTWNGFPGLIRARCAAVPRNCWRWPGELAVRHLLLDMNTAPDIPFQQEGRLGSYWLTGLVQLPLARLVLAIGRE